MAELENIIQSVMSSPESMNMIMNVAKMLGGSGEEEKTSSAEKFPDFGVGGAGIDDEAVSKIIKLVGESSSDGDKRIRLLGAIKPYLREEDGIHVDKAIRIVKLAHVAKGVFRDFLK